MRALVPMLTATLVPALAHAHPDHAGSAAVGVVHYLSDPFHLATYAICATAAVVLGAAWQRKRSPVSER